MKVTMSKQAILTTVIGVGLVCALPTVASAVVTGQCSNCHTMHNSQNGSSVVGSMEGVLLGQTCAGCHTDDGSGLLTAVGAPAVVVSTSPGGTPLPGGFINTTNADNTMHNVTSTGASADGVLTSPPGYDAVAAGALGLPNPWDLATDPLTCAGATGCHGDHTQATNGGAIRGGHHNATAIGYRLLDGINGTESPSYTALNNTYAAVDGNDGSTTTTISYLCSECHGDFHGNDTDTLSGGAWIRHPSDLALGSATGTGDAYASYGTAGNPYDEQVPVGTTQASVTINAADTAAWPDNSGGTGTTAMVMCISCHRAHGSDNADLLRWDYTTISAGTTGAGAGTGCFRCHTNKDGV